ncbi:hypothetical protein QJS04_geneDACA015121 [Acorus gramineus]|uniref:Bifunctional inhibitor/plant lipid transfer protein/seed storage helical domain-containing protein n=1 Tax=Acorus gramineus TaxID=55184 RepID=A0AAV9BXM1_ACOGR|nr:hypothetical protein QJS04_geneDACA015121 [Acorus gramineus]
MAFQTRIPILAVAFVLLAVSTIGALAQDGPAAAPAPGLDCTDALVNLSSCLTYVEEGSNLTRPEKGCCPGLAGLVANTPQCLCQLLSSGEAFGLQIDRTKALALPTACRVDTPPISLCSVFGYPVPSPQMSPVMPPSPAGAAPVGSSPSVGPGGMATTASPPKSNHGVSRFEFSALNLLICLCTFAVAAIF